MSRNSDAFSKDANLRRSRLTRARVGNTMGGRWRAAKRPVQNWRVDTLGRRLTSRLHWGPVFAPRHSEPHVSRETDPPAEREGSPRYAGERRRAGLGPHTGFTTTCLLLVSQRTIASGGWGGRGVSGASGELQGARPHQTRATQARINQPRPEYTSPDRNKPAQAGINQTRTNQTRSGYTH